jgi:phospholipid/cholesterol/gamma-HCH transport system substrate-binding protein
VTQTTRNFLLGLTSIGGLVALMALLMLFGELEAVMKPRYVLTIDCTNAVGLRAGSTIELNGVPIGQVDEVMAVQQPRYPVRIQALIDRHVGIPEGVELYATSSLLGGSATLQLEAPPDPDAPVLARDGSAHLADEIRSRLIAQLTSELDARMGPVVEAMKEFELLARNLNELVEPFDPDDSAADARNIRTAVATLNEVLEDVHEALSMAKSWLGDEKIRADATEAVQKAGVLIDQATATLDEFTKLAGRLDTDVDTVVEHLIEVSDEMTTTLQEVRGLARKASSGEGTVGQLLNNPDLYESLDDAADRMERTLRDIQLLLDKIKDDGIGAAW